MAGLAYWESDGYNPTSSGDGNSSHGIYQVGNQLWHQMQGSGVAHDPVGQTQAYIDTLQHHPSLWDSINDPQASYNDIFNTFKRTGTNFAFGEGTRAPAARYADQFANAGYFDNQPWSPPGSLPGNDIRPEDMAFPQQSPAENWPSSGSYSPNMDNSFTQGLMSPQDIPGPMNGSGYQGSNIPTNEGMSPVGPDIFGGSLNVPTNESMTPTGPGYQAPDSFNVPTNESMQPSMAPDAYSSGTNVPTNESMTPDWPAPYSQGTPDFSNSNYTSPAYTGDMPAPSVPDFGNLPESNLSQRPSWVDTTLQGLGLNTAQSAGGPVPGFGTDPFVGGAFSSSPGGVSYGTYGQGSAGDIPFFGQIDNRAMAQGNPALGLDSPGGAVPQFAAHLNPQELQAQYAPAWSQIGQYFQPQTQGPFAGGPGDVTSRFGPNGRQMSPFSHGGVVHGYDGGGVAGDSGGPSMGESYAFGGVVHPYTPPMRGYGKDTVPAALTPGEVVLNKPQQAAVSIRPGMASKLRPDQISAIHAIHERKQFL